ncbi:MAG: HAD-IA family hydrolase [Candidatus Peregrinibacteria bacterium]
MPPRAVIFDFDGVIVDSERYWQTEEQSFFKKILTGWDGSHHHDIVGLSVEGSYRYFKDAFAIELTLPEYLENYARIADRVYAQCQLLPGVETFLKILEEAKLPLAIASSARRKRIEHIIDKFELRKYFQVIVSAEDLPPDAGKPKPTIYLTAASLLGIKPEECVAIEDAKNGVLSAKSAGMKCIGLRNGVNEEQDLSAADVVIREFAEMDAEIFKKL